MAGYVFFPIFTFAIFSNPALYASQLKEYMKFDAPPDHEELDMLEQLKESVRRKEVEKLMKQYESNP